MASQQVRCTVSSCYYYGAGDNCVAEEIMVRANPATMGHTDFETGEMGGQARQSNQTLCETFIPQEKGPKPGINRIKD